MRRQIEELRQEEDEIITESIRGAAMRSRCLYYEEGDKNSKFFLNIQKHQAKKKCIERLRNEEGQLITDQKQIRKEEETFYKKLYSSTLKTSGEKRPNQDLEDLIFTLESPKIDKDLHEDLIKPISQEEIKKL